MISATVITFNEEKNIGKVLENLKNFADEVIIVDSGSKDKTIEIAKTYGAKIYSRQLDNFANQKNWAVSKTTGDWILSIDADERIPEELKEEIRQAVRNSRYSGFLIPRRNFILGKEIKYSRWSPDRHIWFWNKRKGQWVGEVHEEVILNGEVGMLKNSKIHNSHETVKEFIQANIIYSRLEAQSLLKKGKRFSFWNMIWQSLFEFIIRFIYKRGFLDGKEGFILAYLMGMYKLMIWIKLWELNTIN